MTARERFLKALNFETPEDRLPLVEWAAWWNKTTERWFGEGLPVMDTVDILKYFDLDILVNIIIPLQVRGIPAPVRHGAGIIKNEEDYEKVREYLFKDELLEKIKTAAFAYKEKHDKGEIIIRLWLDGFFWFPRKMFGIEDHVYAFFDYPELMHRINEELSDFLIKAIHTICPILKPDMAGFAEDMSYNHGPMLSYELFREFLLPYYKKVIPHLKQYGIKVLVDSDGDITSMIPWLNEAGIEGVYPLERQAGVDINEIRKMYPDFLMLGGYDKMVMPLGEEAMREEFERILPVMRSGGYIPSVDHQTPPGVSLENYKIYVELFNEYARKAVRR